MAARGKTSGGEQRQREHAETAAGPRRIDVSFPFQPVSVIREGAFTLFGGLDDPVAECDGGFIGTELVEVTAPDEAGARAALRIKGKALDDKYREKYKCEKEYCERAGAKCVSAPDGLVNRRSSPSLTSRSTTTGRIPRSSRAKSSGSGAGTSGASVGSSSRRPLRDTEPARRAGSVV